jgi:DnaJ-domain-containing protein 1
MISAIAKLAVYLWCLSVLIGLLVHLIRPVLYAIAAGCSLLQGSIRLIGQVIRLFPIAPRGCQPETGNMPCDAKNFFYPHGVLGVAVDASQESIKAAYLELIKRNHPDKVASLDPAILELATERTKQIRRAFEMIGGKQ